MKLKIVIITFLSTTAFWCAAIVGVFWLGAREVTSVGVIEDPQRKGFMGIIWARNTETRPVTFTVEELRTNFTLADTSRGILIERQLPPSGEFWVAIRKAKPEKR